MFSTREPSDEQLEVGVVALTEILRAETELAEAPGRSAAGL